MPQSQVNKADQPIRCIACGKVIGQGYIVTGSVKLLCKCGVKTKIEAEKKPEGHQQSFGVRYNEPDASGDIFIPGCFKNSVFK